MDLGKPPFSEMKAGLNDTKADGKIEILADISPAFFLAGMQNR